MNYCNGEENTASTMCNPCPYDGKCENCNESDTWYPWDRIWTAPDGTFKGRCDNCGFVHYFIEGHVTQYKFCPQCGEQKSEL